MNSQRTRHPPSPSTALHRTPPASHKSLFDDNDGRGLADCAALSADRPDGCGRLFVVGYRVFGRQTLARPPVRPPARSPTSQFNRPPACSLRRRLGRITPTSRTSQSCSTVCRGITACSVAEALLFLVAQVDRATAVQQREKYPTFSAVAARSNRPSPARWSAARRLPARPSTRNRLEACSTRPAADVVYAVLIERRFTLVLPRGVLHWSSLGTYCIRCH